SPPAILCISMATAFRYRQDRHRRPRGRLATWLEAPAYVVLLLPPDASLPPSLHWLVHANRRRPHRRTHLYRRYVIRATAYCARKYTDTLPAKCYHAASHPSHRVQAAVPEEQW